MPTAGLGDGGAGAGARQLALAPAPFLGAGTVPCVAESENLGLMFFVGENCDKDLFSFLIVNL